MRYARMSRALVADRDLLDLARDPIELARPPRGGLDEFERHVLVVTDVPGVHAVLTGGGEHAIGGLAPGETDAAGFFADLDLRGIGDPFALIGQQNIEAAAFRPAPVSQLDLHQRGANLLFRRRRQSALARGFRDAFAGDRDCPRRAFPRMCSRHRFNSIFARLTVATVFPSAATAASSSRFGGLNGYLRVVGTLRLRRSVFSAMATASC